MTVKLSAKDLEWVVFRDDSSYVPGKEENGGGYRYTITYERVPGTNFFEVEYSTSSEFDYCRRWGTFQSCERCPYHLSLLREERWQGMDDCGAPRKRVTDEELQKLLDKVGDKFYVNDYGRREKNEDV